MLSYIVKRILSLIPVLFVVSWVVFLVVYLIPGGPATALLGMEATPAQIEELNAELGFDRPVLVQYADWFAGIFKGDWGDSFFLQQSVLEAIGEYFLPTLSLAILAQIFALALSVPFGILAAYRRGTALDVAAVSICGGGAAGVFAQYVSNVIFRCLSSVVPGCRICRSGRGAGRTSEIFIRAGFVPWYCPSGIYYANDKVFASGDAL